MLDLGVPAAECFVTDRPRQRHAGGSAAARMTLSLPSDLRIGE